MQFLLHLKSLVWDTNAPLKGGKSKMMKVKKFELREMPTAHSERIVVDELMYEGRVRLLRAKYRGDLTIPPSDQSFERLLGIENWGTEREYVMHGGLVEAFVGYKSPLHLQEGDVFYVRDGRKLTSRYKPIERDLARRKNLLVDFKESGIIARADIKKEYRKLKMINATRDKKEQMKLRKLVDKFVQMPVVSRGWKDAK